MELSLKQVFGIRQTDYYSTNSGVQPSDYLDCLWNIRLKKDRQERRVNPSQRNSICQFLGEHLWHEKYHFKICFSKVLLFCQTKPLSQLQTVRSTKCLAFCMFANASPIGNLLKSTSQLFEELSFSILSRLGNSETKINTCQWHFGWVCMPSVWLPHANVLRPCLQANETIVGTRMWCFVTIHHPCETQEAT